MNETATKRKKIIDDAQPEASENGQPEQPEPLTEADRNNLQAVFDAAGDVMTMKKSVQESLAIYSEFNGLLTKILRLCNGDPNA